MYSLNGYTVKVWRQYSLWIEYSFMDTLFDYGYSIQLWIECLFNSKIQYSLMDRLFKFMGTVFNCG